MGTSGEEVKVKFLFVSMLFVGCALCGCEDDDKSTTDGGEQPAASALTANDDPLPPLPGEVVVQSGDFRISAYLTLAGKSTQAVDSGQTPALHLRVAYSGSSQTNVTFNDGKVYDFIVLDERGKTIWQWSGDKGFTAAFRDLTINPDEVLDYKEAWTASVDRGMYELRAIWSVWPEPPPAKVWFHVDR